MTMNVCNNPPPILPPLLLKAPPSDYDERAAIADLLKEGYVVSVIDPYANLFNEKYSVSQNLPVLGNQIIPVDEYGCPLSKAD